VTVEGKCRGRAKVESCKEAIVFSGCKIVKANE
jgi:hypothetical protein